MIHLTKHHALGNDFLVCDTAQIEPGAPEPAWSKCAELWCHRRRGIGADGLLLLGIIGPQELTMVLYNADGSRAEISGNGIRCLVQAAIMAQQRSEATTYLVHTDAGERFVDIRLVDDNVIEASASMGPISPIAEPLGWNAIGADPMRPVSHLSCGNPHTVVGVEDVRVVDLLALGRRIPQVNLEIIEPGPGAAAITMRVHERGAGITDACGSGACAGAWAALQWGLVAAQDGEILVHMDGGDARVRLHQPEHGHVTLVGPSVFVAHLQIEAP